MCSKNVTDQIFQRLYYFNSSDEQSESDIIDDQEIEQFNVALSDNFTTCVTKYSKCLDYRGDQTYCTDQFHECSLGILSDARLNDKEVQSFVYDPTQNQGKGS